jgi:hypothetical protein
MSESYLAPEEKLRTLAVPLGWLAHPLAIR